MSTVRDTDTSALELMLLHGQLPLVAHPLNELLVEKKWHTFVGRAKSVER